MFGTVTGLSSVPQPSLTWSPEQIGALRKTRARPGGRAEISRHRRTIPPQVVTAAEAAAELEDTALAELTRLARLGPGRPVGVRAGLDAAGRLGGPRPGHRRAPETS